MLRNHRRLLAALGAAFLAGAPATLHAQSGQPVRGDVDGDGRVTAADARIVSDFLVGRPVPPGVDVRLRGDVNGDGRVTAADAAIISRAAAGRDVSRFPVGAVIPDAALAVLECTGSLRTLTVDCHKPGAPATNARREITFGGQGEFVKLTSANVQLNPVDSILQFTVTVENLLAQAMSADSGTGVASAAGIRVFFANGPVGTSVPGTMTVAEADGVGMFTASNQPYFQYAGADLGGDGILSPAEVSSPRTWKLRYSTPDPVNFTFSFLLYVRTEMQFPFGWVDISPPAHLRSPYIVYSDTVPVGSTSPLQATVRDVFGRDTVLPVRWSNTAYGHATVDSITGVVSTSSVGVDSVIATSGPRSGRVRIVVSPLSADSATITPSLSTILANESSVITVQARDVYGNIANGGGATVTLTTNQGTLTAGPSTGTTVTAVDQGDGTYTATLTDTIVGTATVTGTLNGNAIQDNATVTIGARGVHHFTVEAAGGGNIPDQLVNAAFNVKVTARDTFNNTATSFTGKVGFTSTPGGGISLGAGPSADFSAGVLSSHQITFGTAGAFTLTATRTGGSEAGTSNSFQVQAPPTAVNEGPAPTSVPNDPYHTAFNTTYNLPTLGLLSNDTRGFPLAMVTSFGADSLGGTVTSHAAGSTVSPLPNFASGSLTVNADGSVAFTPPTGFTGLYVFKYRIGNVRGTSDAQVTIAVGVRPAANADTYPHNLLGNVPINTATSTNFNVTTNDAGDAKVVELGSATNGTAVLNPNGTFTFTPSAGHIGSASFTYTLKNGFGAAPVSATVSMTVSGIAWFIDKGAAAGDGRFGTPFNDLSTAFAAVTKPQANQPIFLYHDPTSYTGGVTLLANQRLVGEGATGASFAAVMGVTWPADAGPQPTIGGTRPTVISGLTLGSGNTLQGFDLGGAGTLSGNSFGTLTVSEVAINTTGQALNLTTGTISGGFTGVTSSGGTNNIALSGVTLSGAVDLGGGALSGATGSGLVVTNGTSATASDVLSYSGSITNGTANASVAVSGGSTRLTLTGSVAQTGAGAVVSASGGHTGTLTFQTGTVSASTGTGLQFDNADGTYAFNNGASLTGGDAGIDVLNGSGGTFTFPTSSVITNPTNEAIRINASAPTFSYLGRITKNNGSTGITVTSNTGGSISFGSRLKTITATGGNTAVNLTSNGSATITSVDSLAITSATGNGYNATGGGTVAVTGANNTISSSGGIALNVANTTIGASNLTFRSISANGGSSGIVLNATGASGGLTVTGDGATAGTGGTIQNTSGAGISLTSTTSPSFTRMIVQNTSSHGISGSLVNNFSFTNSTITVSGTSEVAGRQESNISFYQNSGTGTEQNVTGTVTITGNTLNTALHHGVNITQYAGTISSLNISNNTFTSATASSGSTSGATTSHGTAININPLGSPSTVASITSATVSNNVITGFPGNAGILFSAGNSNTGGPTPSYGTVGDSIDITTNRIRGHSTVNPLNTQAVFVALNGKGTAYIKVADNGTLAEPITNMTGHAINASVFGQAVLNIRVQNNRIVANNTLGSQGISMGVDSAAGFATTAVMNAIVTANNVSATNGSGIFASATRRGTMNARVSSNTVAAPGSGTYGIQLLAATALANTGTACYDIASNNTAGGVNGGTTFPGIGLRRQSGAATAPNVFGITGLSPSPTGTPTVENYVNGKNTSASGTFGTGGTALVSASTGFTSCTLAF